jgi:methyl-branched lipid omega-hydroxylase
VRPRPVPLQDIDLTDLDFWGRPPEEIEGAFELLRAEHPLAHFADPDLRTDSALAPPPGDGYRAVVRHADVSAVSRRPDVFRSGPGAVSMIDMPTEMVEYFSSMISTDDPRHARLRRIVSGAFTPRRVRSIEDRVHEVATAIVDRTARLGPCDFVSEVAAALPLRIICDMMGIPEGQHDTVLRCSNVILSMGDPDLVPEGTDPIVAFLGAGQELTELMTDLGRFRAEHPTDDVTSALINANPDGEALTQSELASFFILLVVAGNETTRNAISHGLVLLTEHPEQRARWVEDLPALTPHAVEEIVRYSSPVIWMRRTVAPDVGPQRLGDGEVLPGEKVLLFYNSANRDERVFSAPHRFDLERDPNPHLGFGAAGPHFCLGAHLARREIGVMFGELLTRLPDIEAAGPPERLRSNFINGIKHLPCTFSTPRGRRTS